MATQRVLVIGGKRREAVTGGHLVQASDERDVFQASPDDLPVIDIHSL